MTQTHNGSTFDPVERIDSGKRCVFPRGEVTPQLYGRTLEVNWLLAGRQVGQGGEPANLWGHDPDLPVPLV